MAENMESWRKTWREGFAPLLPLAGLEALLKAAEEDDPRLIQEATTTPPPLQCVQDWPVEAADSIAFAGWQGLGLTTVGAAEEFFAETCFAVDQALGEPAACRYYLNWYDETERKDMLRELIPEIRLAISQR